jgi:hypothetical protein
MVCKYLSNARLLPATFFGVIDCIDSLNHKKPFVPVLKVCVLFFRRSSVVIFSLLE